VVPAGSAPTTIDTHPLIFSGKISECDTTSSREPFATLKSVLAQVSSGVVSVIHFVCHIVVLPD
jgi:hypothetical protein